jgi:hypothetical protein
LVVLPALYRLVETRERLDEPEQEFG